MDREIYYHSFDKQFKTFLLHMPVTLIKCGNKAQLFWAKLSSEVRAESTQVKQTAGPVKQICLTKQIFYSSAMCKQRFTQGIVDFGET